MLFAYIWFYADCLILDKPLVHSSLGKTISPFLIIPLIACNSLTRLETSSAFPFPYLLVSSQIENLKRGTDCTHLLMKWERTINTSAKGDSLGKSMNIWKPDINYILEPLLVLSRNYWGYRPSRSPMRNGSTKSYKLMFEKHKDEESVERRKKEEYEGFEFSQGLNSAIHGLSWCGAFSKNGLHKLLCVLGPHGFTLVGGMALVE